MAMELLTSDNGDFGFGPYVRIDQEKDTLTVKFQKGGERQALAMKYRKKPIEIEAFQWTGTADQTEAPEWIVDAIKNGSVFFGVKEDGGCDMIIETLEGAMRAAAGDFVIKGVKGELYPCKPDIFAATYEPA